MAEIVTIDPARPEPAFRRAREVICSGGIIAYPTETFYGLGVDPRDPAAVETLFAAKGRQEDQPVLLLLPGAGDVARWAAAIPAAAALLMDRFWPGPLTLVFTAAPGVPPALTGGKGTIGLRVPGSGLCRGLLAYLGTGLTGTSANRAGASPPATAEAVLRGLGDRIDLVLDAGPTPGGLPSTVLDVRFDPPRVVREGAVSVAGLIG